MKKRLPSGLTLLLLGCSSLLLAADQKNIYENIDASSKHTILLTAIKEAGLVEALSAKGANTLFAPNDDAFRKLSDEQLQRIVDEKDLLGKIVRVHIHYKEALKLDDLKKMAGKDINGFTISVRDNGAVHIGEAKVVATNPNCTNGVIHTIDTVLIPKTPAKP